MNDNQDIEVYLSDSQFSQLIEVIKSEKETTTTSSEVSDASFDSSLSEIDVLSYILLAQFIIIGILAWALVRNK